MNNISATSLALFKNSKIPFHVCTCLVSELYVQLNCVKQDDPTYNYFDIVDCMPIDVNIIPEYAVMDELIYEENMNYLKNFGLTTGRSSGRNNNCSLVIIVLAYLEEYKKHHSDVDFTLGIDKIMDSFELLFKEIRKKFTKYQHGGLVDNRMIEIHVSVEIWNVFGVKVNLYNFADGSLMLINPKNPRGNTEICVMYSSFHYTELVQT